MDIDEFAQILMWDSYDRDNQLLESSSGDWLRSQPFRADFKICFRCEKIDLFAFLNIQRMCMFRQPQSEKIQSMLETDLWPVDLDDHS